jgi:hypothetical protein
MTELLPFTKLTPRAQQAVRDCLRFGTVFEPEVGHRVTGRLVDAGWMYRDWICFGALFPAYKLTDDAKQAIREGALR